MNPLDIFFYPLIGLACQIKQSRDQSGKSSQSPSQGRIDPRTRGGAAAWSRPNSSLDIPTHESFVYSRHLVHERHVVEKVAQ